jgi:GT2 family glycosyltransferase
LKNIGGATDRSERRDLERDPSVAFDNAALDNATPPRLSVIVPVHNGRDDLARCLAALKASDLPRSEWELIVIDDSSSSALSDLRRNGDQFIRLEGGPHGPAFARNRGVDVARASTVAFVDADVMVHPTALSLMLENLESSETVAVFGSYDDSPSARGAVAQYRNLLHHYVHQRSGGDVESFWAGCGAIRKDVFQEAGGFDEYRYRRPEMEDVELGYRLRDAGHRILLDPSILATHLKRWTLYGMISSDFARRSVPWTMLLLRRKMLLSPRGLSLGAAERASVALSGLLVFALMAVLLAPGTVTVVAVIVTFAAFVLANHQLFSWLSKKRGLRFALCSVPLHLMYNVTGIAGLVWGTIRFALSDRSAPERYTHSR